MKSNIYYRILSIFFTLGFMSCGGNENFPTKPEKNQYEDIQAIVEPSASFAGDDGSIALNGSSASNVARLLSHTGHNIIKGMGEIQITDAEYQEIKVFTDELVGKNTTHTEIYQTIFRWITANIHLLILRGQEMPSTIRKPSVSVVTEDLSTIAPAETL